MIPNRSGYRGYICARMNGGRSVPQHIQQLVIRDYCALNNLRFLLSVVEYRMPGCTMILDAVLDELDHLEGITFYSFFNLPERKEARMRLYGRVLAKGCSLHLAAENMSISSPADIAPVEDSYRISTLIAEQSAEVFAYLADWDRHAGD